MIFRCDICEIEEKGEEYKLPKGWAIIPVKIRGAYFNKYICITCRHCLEKDTAHD